MLPIPVAVQICLVLSLSSVIRAITGDIRLGVEVPGRSVPVLQLLENYAASCVPHEKEKEFGFSHLSQIMKQLNAEDVAKKMYNSLFFSIGDVNINHLMGRWYTVVDSRLMHTEDCTVTYMHLLAKTQYTATFSVAQYSMRGDHVVMNEGYGRMEGPDPGQLLISTGHENDECPYVPVRLGGQHADASFEYIILSQPLKFPSMVLARDPQTFRLKYFKEVYDFVEQNGFMSPMSALNSRLHFVDSLACSRSRLSYEHLPFL